LEVCESLPIHPIKTTRKEGTVGEIDLMNKGLRRQVLKVILSLRYVGEIDLMKKGLRLSCGYVISDDEKGWRD
jgi:hypothetical protein